MKNAADFRSIARDALGGRWIIALLVGLVASILGGIGSSGPEFKINFDVSGGGADLNFMFGNQTIFSTNGGLNPNLQVFLAGSVFVIVLIALAIAVLYFVLGSFVGVGYARFNLDLVDHMETGFEALFSYVSHWKTTAAAKFLRGIYTFLWGLLFIIPGIMASYSYAMTDFILSEHPELTASEAIAKSKEMMYGNRIRLFCLDFSFIGWAILCAFTFGIGNLWLTPYIQAAKAAFYREVSGTEYKKRGYDYEEHLYEGEVI